MYAWRRNPLEIRIFAHKAFYRASFVQGMKIHAHIGQQDVKSGATRVIPLKVVLFSKVTRSDAIKADQPYRVCRVVLADVRDCDKASCRTRMVCCLRPDFRAMNAREGAQKALRCVVVDDAPPRTFNMRS